MEIYDCFVDSIEETKPDANTNNTNNTNKNSNKIAHGTAIVTGKQIGRAHV